MKVRAQIGKVLNLDFSAPDRFTLETGAKATIFVAAGEEFVRVTTSVKKENGERAVGTQLNLVLGVEHDAKVAKEEHVTDVPGIQSPLSELGRLADRHLDHRRATRGGDLDAGPRTRCRHR